VKKIAVILLLTTGLAHLPVAAQTATELKIKTLSTFNALPTTRDPFWPVGWSRPTAVEQVFAAIPMPTVAPEIHPKPEDFVVSSISTGKLPLAVINGRAYAEGELITINVGAPKPMIVQVYSIRDGSVTLRFQNRTVLAPLKGTHLLPH